MSVGAVLRALLAELHPEDRAAVRHVRLRCKPRPDAADLARGCLPDQHAAYYGRARELGQLGEADGEITLYIENLQPLTPGRVRVALEHELLHALGWDEAAIRDMGLFLDDGGKQACCG